MALPPEVCFVKRAVFTTSAASISLYLCISFQKDCSIKHYPNLKLNIFLVPNSYMSLLCVIFQLFSKDRGEMIVSKIIPHYTDSLVDLLMCDGRRKSTQLIPINWLQCSQAIWERVLISLLQYVCVLK